MQLGISFLGIERNVEQILLQNEGTFGLCNSSKKGWNSQLFYGRDGLWQVRAALLPWNLQQQGLEAKLLLPKGNAQQERLDMETVLCLLQEKQTAQIRAVQKEAVLLVFSKAKRMQDGEVYNAAERGVCLLFLYKNYRLDISNMS